MLSRFLVWKWSSEAGCESLLINPGTARSVVPMARVREGDEVSGGEALAGIICLSSIVN